MSENAFVCNKPHFNLACTDKIRNIEGFIIMFLFRNEVYHLHELKWNNFNFAWGISKFPIQAVYQGTSHMNGTVGELEEKIWGLKTFKNF